MWNLHAALGEAAEGDLVVVVVVEVVMVVVVVDDMDRGVTATDILVAVGFHMRTSKGLS